jgi:hypothetical protein
MSRACVAALVVATAASAVAGCGSSGHKKELTRTQLIARADSVCGRFNTQFARVQRADTRQSFIRVASELAAIGQATLVEMRRLVPPSELASDWTRILDGTKALAAADAAIATDVKAHNLRQIGSDMAQAKPEVERMLAIARRDGFVECSKLA